MFFLDINVRDPLQLIEPMR